MEDSEGRTHRDEGRIRPHVWGKRVVTGFAVEIGQHLTSLAVDAHRDRRRLEAGIGKIVQECVDGWRPWSCTAPDSVAYANDVTVEIAA